MFNLSNFKAGQTKTEGDVSVTKTDAGYEVSQANVAAGTLAYDKAEKAWVFTSEGRTHLLTATAKTVVDQVLAIWATTSGPAPEPVDETEAEEPAGDEAKPSSVKTRDKVMDRIEAAMALAQNPAATQEEAETALAAVARLMDKHSITAEELRRRKAAEAGKEVEAEPIISWTFKINVQGGHALHRVAAFYSVIMAMGGRGFYTHSKIKGAGYKADTVIMHVFAQPAVIEDLKVFIPLMELQMERLGDAVSKERSRQSREAGGHHSGPGCHARRGFMRGFGAGIAFRITQGREEMEDQDSTGSTALVLRDRATSVDEYMAKNHANPKTAKAQKYDSAAWSEGHRAGVAFASPGIGSEPATAVLSAS